MVKEEQSNFFRCHISEEMLDNLEKLKYNRPTEIQEAMIPFVLEGKDIVAKSKTGSGKTAAFGIPICEMTTWEGRIPQALIIEPTRELAEQVRMELFCLSRNKRLKIPAVFGGFPIDKQIQTLKQKNHIVVGTPGRILDHLRKETLNVAEVRIVVIDEADLMFDMGFIEDVKKILDQLSGRKQMILCSATMGNQIEKMVEEYMEEPERIMLGKDEITAKEITQILYRVKKEEKYLGLKQIIWNYNPQRCVIFCGTKEMVQVLYQKLKKEKIYAVVLHGDQDQKERMKAVDDFSLAKSRFLIATDIASRGIDFTKVSHVINFDFPTGKETYVHRIGRTGRNDESGIAISLVSEDDVRMKESVEQYIQMEFEVLELPTVSTEQKELFFKTQRKAIKPEKRKDAVFHQEITKLNIGGGRKSKMRAVDIVGAICSIEGISSDDIGIIDVRDSLTYVEILHNKGDKVFQCLQTKAIKGKIRKVKKFK